MRLFLGAFAMTIVLGFCAACGSSSSSSKRPSRPAPTVNPTPADGAIDVALNATLSWDPAARTDLYAVYFGTSSPGTFLGSQPGTTFDPGLLVAGVRYFWKIDSVNSVDITTGAVWTFDTVPPPPAQVGNPSPRNEEGDVSSGAILTWDMATGAASYDVYFGTWNPGSPGSPGVLQGNQTGTSFDPGPLANLTRYVWRIDAINAGGTTTGPVWSFTTFPRGEDRTLVVDNLQSPTSQAIASYYRGLRPSTRLLTIDVVEQETVNRATFDTDILAPIETYLVNGGLQDEIWYIVTTKGVPLRISGNPGSVCVSDERASVDSELTHALRPVGLPGKVFNPFYGATVPFSRPAIDLYLVCRLTGYETDVDLDGIPDDCKALIDRGFSPVPGPVASPTGKFVLDQWPPRGVLGNDWMVEADGLLQAAGLNTVLDQTNTYLRGETEVLGYASWGSNDGDNNTPPYATMHQFVPGAVVTTYVSTSARSFMTGTAYGQSLIADLIGEGITGANGHVYEPCLDAVARPQLLLDRYTKGWNLAESYYASIRYLSWMNVVVGDPLCSPWE